MSPQDGLFYHSNYGCFWPEIWKMFFVLPKFKAILPIIRLESSTARQRVKNSCVWPRAAPLAIGRLRYDACGNIMRRALIWHCVPFHLQKWCHDIFFARVRIVLFNDFYYVCSVFARFKREIVLRYAWMRCMRQCVTMAFSMAKRVISNCNK